MNSVSDLGLLIGHISYCEACSFIIHPDCLKLMSDVNFENGKDLLHTYDIGLLVSSCIILLTEIHLVERNNNNS